MYKRQPREYEEASLALGATHIETVFRVSVPAARSGIATAIVLGIGRAIGEDVYKRQGHGAPRTTDSGPLLE